MLLLTFAQIKILWWILLAILFAGVFVMDGLVCGALIMMPFVSRNDTERRVIINSIGPVWESNQVWLVLAGGALFAAWPLVYAVMCSAFYLAIFLLLLCLILRPVGFKFRNKIDSQSWRNAFDTFLFIGGLAPSFLLGVVIGNMMVGLDFSLDSMLRPDFGGGFIELLNPFALLCGAINVLFSVRQGAVYLKGKTESYIGSRVGSWFKSSTYLLTLLFFAVAFYLKNIDGYVVVSALDPEAQPNPLGKTVVAAKGLWLNNYSMHPSLLIMPIISLICLFISHVLFTKTKEVLMTFLASAKSVIFALLSVGAAMYPFFLPSRSDPASSLLIWDASSSHYTLTIMTVITVICLPCVLAYVAWVYKVFNYKLSTKDILAADKNEVY